MSGFNWKLIEVKEENLYRYEPNIEAIFDDARNRMMEIEEEIAIQAVIEVLRDRGYTVTKNEEES